MKTHSWIISLLVVALLLCLFLFKNGGKEPAIPEVTSVMCNEGDSLADKLSNAAPGQKFVLLGTCEGEKGNPVVIKANDVTLIGGTITGGPDRPALTVTGENTTFIGIKVTKSLHGIVVKEGGSFHLKNSFATGNKGAGICILDKRTSERKSNPEQTGSYQSSPSSSLPFIPDPTDPCMARVNPDFIQPKSSTTQKPSTSEPQYPGIPDSSSAILDLLVPKALAASHTCIATNTDCDGDYSGNGGFGIVAVGAGLKSLINCNTRVENNGVGGIAAVGSGTFCTKNTILNVINNNIVGLYVDGASQLFTSNSTISSSGHSYNAYLRRTATITCNSSTVNLNGQPAVIEDPGAGGSSYGC